MNQHRVNQEIAVVGIDLGKTWIQVCGQDGAGKVCLERRMKPAALRTWLCQLPPCRIGMEACGRSHHWARTLQGYGHEVRLIAPQFVKPFVKTNKTDRADAEAICEAVQRPSMRYVGIKTITQQDQQAVHRIRRLAVGQRTAQVNQIRGLLAEYGIEIARGRSRVRSALPGILEDGENGLSSGFRACLAELYEELVHLDARIGQLDRQIERMAHTHAQARRLMGIPGVGPMTATALLAAAGDVKMFRNSRQFAAWLGLVPRQHSDRRQGPVAGHLQARRPLCAQPVDPWGPLGHAAGGQPAGYAKSVGTPPDRPASQERRRGGAGSPHGAHRLGVAGASARLRAGIRLKPGPAGKNRRNRPTRTGERLSRVAKSTGK